MAMSEENERRIRAACRKAGRAWLAPKIMSLAKPCVRLALNRVPDEEHTVGKTRVGGLPDLPADFDWPHWKNEPLSFLAQIELEALSGFPGTDVLPSQGLLSFFYDPLQSTWGFDPQDAGSWRVIWTESKNLAPHPLPAELPCEGRFDACAAEFLTDVSLPAWDSVVVNSWKLRKLHTKCYSIIEDELRGEADLGTVSWLLGHADPIQNDMQIECALVTNGLCCGDASSFHDARAKVFAREAPRWRLLLQLASEEQAGMMWGDAGCLYFWIHEQDLARRQFDRVWMILQCG